MTIEIRNRFTGVVLYTHDGGHIGEAVIAALKSWANLHEADLRGADLHEADLHEADLDGADLHEADLRGADLGGAYYIVELPVADPRGYRLIATRQNGAGEWLLTAGCRGPWTITEARDHWGCPDYDGDPLTARRYMCALDWWEMHGADYRAAAGSDQQRGLDHE